MSMVYDIPLNTEKAQLVEGLKHYLHTHDQVIIFLAQDNGDGSFLSQVLLLNVNNLLKAQIFLTAAYKDIQKVLK